MTREDQINALRAHLSGSRFDIVFVNGGVANRRPDATLAERSAASGPDAGGALTRTVDG